MIVRAIHVKEENPESFSTEHNSIFDNEFIWASEELQARLKKAGLK